MKLISSNKIGIQSGTFTMFSDFDKAGEMWVGTGPRERHKRVTFKEKFISSPSVTLNISLWDVHSKNKLPHEIAGHRYYGKWVHSQF